MSKKTRKICIDLTDVAWYACRNETIGGIQRVQLEVARALIQELPDVYVFSDLYLRRVDMSVFLRGRNAAEGYTAIREFFAPNFSTWAWKESRRRIARELELIAGRAAAPVGIHRATFGHEDLIFVGGSFWALRGRSLDLMERSSRRSAAVIALVHDLIPLVYPEFTNGRARPYFERLLSAPICAIANSEHTDLELRRHSKEGGIRSLGVIPLAHEFPGFARGYFAGDPPTARLKALAGCRFALCVGTIEIRKNHYALLRLWEKLRAQFGDLVPKLIVAGREGWMAKEALKLLQSATPDAPYGMLQAPCDSELAWLYSRCNFTVFPSFAEGWGLPVGESLWFGTPCVASARTSIPEVGRDLCLYGDPENIDSFAEPILRLSCDHTALSQSRARIRAARLRTWMQTARSIASRLVDIAGYASVYT